MISKPLPSDFVVASCKITWAEVLWGIEHQWADWTCAVALATARLADGDVETKELIELAGISAREWRDAHDLVQKLASAEQAESPATEESPKVWLFLILQWLYEQRDQYADPLTEVEELYADFGYPPEIESFVRYMPSSGGYDPKKHSAAENQSRMIRAWESYLRDAAHRCRMRS